jgi:Fic-DOC domain mobile mystery protein B
LNDLHAEPDGATPLTAEERAGLIPSHVTLRSELNELEQQNILEAKTALLGKKPNPLSESFALRLHRRMFRHVWKWAGKYRKTDKNLGVPHYEVQTALIGALDNAQYWVDHKSFSADEIAVRLHHDVVWVHPFSNGNGRWSRLMADVLITRLGGLPFTWGGGSLVAANDTRKAYIKALKLADNHEYESRVAFSRS